MSEAVMLYDAMIAGKLWATSLTAGDLFVGCSPEAKHRYPASQSAQRLFIHGAMDVLDRTDIYVSDNGYITRVERRSDDETKNG